MSDLRWKCNPGPQREFVFGRLGRVREVLYGGQKGGGKSDAIVPKCYKHIGENPGAARVLILRETHPELTELIDRMRPQCLAQGAVWHEQRKTWTFPCGAKIRFGHLSDGCDPYWGLEFSLIIVDEVTRCIATEADYLKLLGSLRNSKGVPCQVVLMSNPGGKGHAWVKARFMGVPPRTVYKDPATNLERVFIPASLESNPHLPPEYRATLEQLPEAERDAYLHGNWDAFEGRIFKLLPGIHLVPKQDIPSDWTRFRSMDWGYARPFAIYWYAVDFEGRAYVYREWYGAAKDGKGGFIANEGARIEPEKVAEKIALIEKEAGEREVIGIADPACWAKGQGDHGGGPSIIEAMQKHGVFWQKGKNDRLQGKMQVHQRLTYELHEDGRVAEAPGLFIVQESCTHLVRTLPALEYDQHRVEDVDTDGEDHAYDSLRYFCMARPWAPKQAKKTDGWRDRQNAPNRNWEWG